MCLDKVTRRYAPNTREMDVWKVFRYVRFRYDGPASLCFPFYWQGGKALTDERNPAFNAKIAVSGYRASFGMLWDSINNGRPGCAWIDNPWVWAVSFKRVQA